MTKTIPNKPYKPVPITECDLKEGLLFYSGLYQEALTSERSLNIKTAYIRCNKMWAQATDETPLGADPSEEEDQKDYPFRCGKPGCCTPNVELLRIEGQLMEYDSSAVKWKPVNGAVSDSKENDISCGMLGCCEENWILGPFYKFSNLDFSEEDQKDSYYWCHWLNPGKPSQESWLSDGVVHIGDVVDYDSTYVSWYQYTEVLKRLVFQLLDCLTERRFNDKMEALCLKNAWVTEDSVKEAVIDSLGEVCAYDIENLDTLVSDIVCDSTISVDQVEDLHSEVNLAVENSMDAYYQDDRSCLDRMVKERVRFCLTHEKQWFEDALKQIKTSRIDILQEIWRRISIAFSMLWKGKK